MSERERCMALSHEWGDFVLGEDGYYVYWPKRESRGSLAAIHLRWLADELDKMNAAWDARVQSDPSISLSPVAKPAHVCEDGFIFNPVTNGWLVCPQCSASTK